MSINIPTPNAAQFQLESGNGEKFTVAIFAVRNDPFFVSVRVVFRDEHSENDQDWSYVYGSEIYDLEVTTDEILMQRFMQLIKEFTQAIKDFFLLSDEPVESGDDLLDKVSALIARLEWDTKSKSLIINKAP